MPSVLRALLLFFGLFLGDLAGVTPSVGDDGFSSPEVLKMADKYGGAISANVAKHDHGVMLSSESFPEAGMLLIKYPDRHTEYCSAQAVAADYLITAAHCFCFGLLDAPSCNPTLAALTAQFFAPSEGVRSLDMGAVTLHPDFQSSKKKNLGPVALADIALAKLSAPIRSYAKVGAFDQRPQAYLTSASFGRFRLTANHADPKKNVLPPGIRWEFGVGQTLGYPTIYSHGACGPTARNDVLCIQASSIATDDPLSADGGFCNGDSGGGLYEWSDTGPELVGVMSFNDDGTECRSSKADNQIAFFVDLTGYSAWIKSIVGERKPPSDPPACQDVLFAGSFRLAGAEAGTASIVPFDEMHDDTDGESRPAPRVAVKNGSCETVAGTQFLGWFCNLALNTEISFAADRALQAVRICRRK